MKYTQILSAIMIAFALWGCKNDDDSTISSCDDESFPENVYEVIDPDFGPISGMVKTQDNHFVTVGDGRLDGPFYDFQLTKFNEQLEVIWTNTYGETNSDFPFSLIATLDDGFLMCGSTFSFGQGGSNLYVVKTNSEGQEEWSNAYGTINSERGNAAIQLDDESFIIVGYSLDNNSLSTDEYIIRIDKDGNQIWSQINQTAFKDRATDIKKTSDGHIAILSSKISANGVDEDLVVTKLDYDGNTIWQQNLGASAGSVLNKKLINTSDNQLLIGASSAEGIDLSSSDFMLIKINEDGEIQWTHTFGTEDRNVFKSVIEGSNNEFLVLGDGPPPCSEGRTDLHLSKINASGDLLWQNTYGGTAYEASNNIIKIKDNEFLVAGHIEGQEFNQDFDLIMFKVDGSGVPK